ALGDDQPGAGALPVVLGRQLGHQPALHGPAPGHRRHHQSVRELQLPLGQRLEQRSHYVLLVRCTWSRTYEPPTTGRIRTVSVVGPVLWMRALRAERREGTD